MAREEAKQYAEEIYKVKSTYNEKMFWKDKFIDAIYDDFESRTCENCKYWEKDDTGYGCAEYRLGYCSKDVGNGFTINNATKHNFGCNEWKQN